MRDIFVIGDSISIQYGPYLKELLEGKFGYDRKSGEEEALLNLDQPMGSNGGDSGMVLDYMQLCRQSGRKYDILLVNCGLHDMKTDPVTGVKQVPMEQYRSNLESIAKLAAEMAQTFVWVRTTDAIEHVHNTPGKTFHRFHADVVAYNEAADAIMRRLGVPVIDLYSFTRTFGESAFCDHVHYTEEVRRLQAAYLTGYLEGRF